MVTAVESNNPVCEIVEYVKGDVVESVKGNVIESEHGQSDICSDDFPDEDIVEEVMESVIMYKREKTTRKQKTGKKTGKTNYTMYNNSYNMSDLTDTLIYDEQKYINVVSGIAQNIYVEMDKQRLSTRGLAEMACLNYSQLTKIFNGKAFIGLQTMLKSAAALRVSPKILLPYDNNERKSNGQRFDELTKGLETKDINFLLDFAAIYVKRIQSLKYLRG